MVSIVFKELVRQILEKIKVEPYFKWPNKNGGDPTRCNQSLYCQYHQYCGHTTKDYRTLRDYLEELVKIRKLRQFLHQPSRQESLTGSAYQRESSSRPPWEQSVLFWQPQVGLGHVHLGLCLEHDHVPRTQFLSLNEGEWKFNHT